MADDLGQVGSASVEITGDYSGLSKDFDKARGVAKAGTESIGKAIANVGKDLSWGLTAPLAALGAGVFKFGTDFETAFAGVKKTVDGSAGDFEKLRNSFRQLSSEIPFSAAELANIGEIAGQMNIPVGNIEEFTRVIANMGVATDLSTEQAAIALGQMSNVMQTPIEDLERLGSTIVYLGNASGATEPQIVEMGQRIAGVGRQLNLSEAQVLSWATALTEVGVDAEAGGTAISTVFKRVAVEVETGGEKLLDFAAVARMSVADFSSLFKRDASAAVEAFVRGLGKIREDGGSTIVTMENLGLTEARVSSSLNLLSGNYEKLTERLQQGDKAWRENVALSREANEFYKTTTNQLKLLANQLADVGIELFDVVGSIIRDTAIPMFKDLAAGVKDAAEWFGQLPSSAQKAGLAIAGVAAAAGPSIWAVGQLADAIGNLVQLSKVLLATNLGFLLTTPLKSIADLRAALQLLAGTTAAVTAAWVGLATVGVGALFAIGKAYYDYRTAVAEAGDAERKAYDDTEALNAKLRVLGLGVSQAGKTWEQYHAEVLRTAQAHALQEAAQKASTVSTGQSAAATEKLALATAASREEAKKAAEEFKRLLDTFTASLKPADDLGVELNKLAKQFTAKDLVSVYGDAIIAAAAKQREHGFVISDTVVRLETLAKAYRKLADEIAPVVELEDGVTQGAKALIDVIQKFGRVAPLSDVFDPADKLPERIDSVATTGVKKLLDMEKQVQATKAAVGELAAAGISSSGILIALGDDLEKAAVNAKALGMELDPATEALIRQAREAKASQEAAKKWGDVWSHAMGQVVSDFATGFADMVVDGESFSMSLTKIFKDLGKTIVKIMVTDAFTSIGKSLSGLLGGTSLGGVLAKIPGLGGIFGGAAAAGTAGAAGAGAGAGGAGAGSAIAGLATNPVTIAAAGAIAGAIAIKKFVGQGRKTANEFVQGVQNPFGAQLATLVDAVDRSREYGTLTLDDAEQARGAITELWQAFQSTAAEFAKQGKNEAKVVEQAQQGLAEYYGRGLSSVFDKLEGSIADLRHQAEVAAQKEETAAEAVQDPFSRAVGLDTSDFRTAVADFKAAVAQFAGNGLRVAQGIPQTVTAFGASQIFAAGVADLVSAWDRGAAIASQAVTVTIQQLTLEAHLHFQGTDVDRSTVRDVIEPELMTMWETGIRGSREKLARIIADTMDGLTGGAVPA